MINLPKIGCIFYGIAIAGMGIQTIYYSDFPYMLLPPNHSWISSHAIFAYVSGAFLLLSGLSIIFEKKTRPISILLGGMLLLVFCFWHIPYEFLATSNYMHLGEWENAEKELTLSAGAFVIAGCFSEKQKNHFARSLVKLMPFGAILFLLMMISFGINHFLYTKDASEYIPSWIPNHIFWTYFAGVALIGSGIAIILKIKPRLNAVLLGTMIFTWFIILHIPKVISAPSDDMGGEVTSAFLALAYSGIAFVIAGSNKKIP